MRCSDCSLPVRPVVAIDIDGTLGDYHGHFLRFAENWLGRQRSTDTWWPYDGGESFSDWFIATYRTDITTFRKIKLAYRQGGMKRTMPIFNGAADLVGEMRERGAEVWLTTTRPWERFDRVDPDTREWLRRHGIEFDGLLFHEDKLAELADRIDPSRVVAVLDDQVEELRAARALGWTGILAESPFNRGVLWSGARASGPLVAARIIDKLITYWEAEHERVRAGN